MNVRWYVLMLLVLMLGNAPMLQAQDSLQWKFMHAVEQNDLRQVKELLKRDADVNMSVVATSPNYLFFISRKFYLQGLAKSRPGEVVYVSPIHANADRADIKILQVLRKKKANIEAGDSDGKTPLMYALRNPGGEAYALYLLKKGANYRSIDLAGNTVMHYAAYGGNIEGLRMTAGGGVDPNVRNAEGITPFHAAAVFSGLPVLQELQGLGADVHARDSVGMGALHYAAAYGDQTKLNWLLNQAPELNDEAQNGYTPLDIARAAKNEEATKFLLSKGGKYSAYRYDEMLAAMKAKNYELLRQILADGVNVNRKDTEYPLILAIQQDDNIAVDLLLAAGANPNILSTHLQRPMELALRQSNPSIGLSLAQVTNAIELADLGACLDQMLVLEQVGFWADWVEAMLRKIPDLDKPCGKLQIPALHYACYMGNENLVQALLAAKADVNAKDPEGWTALHWVVMKRDLLRLHLEKLRIAEALLAAGAQINSPSTAAKTLPHTDPYLAKRIPAHAQAFDLLTYALPKDADLYDLLSSKGGKSNLTAEDYFENGKALYAQREFQSAQLDLNRCIVAQPKNAEAYYYRARCLSMGSMYVEVERDLDKAIQLKPNYADAILARAKARMELNKYAAAESDANLALKMGANKGETLYWRGKIRLRLDNREGACADFRESSAAGFADGTQAIKLYCK